MSFFRQFPTTTYDLQKTGASNRVVDLFRNVTAPQLQLDPTVAYTTYRIQNGDRPDVVSEKLYGDPDYYWTFFIINDHLKSGHASWPMSHNQMETYLTQEYDAYSVIQMADYIPPSPALPHIVTINSVSCGTTVADGSQIIDFVVAPQNVLNSSNVTRSIMKYDSYMQQLWITNSSSTDTYITTLQSGNGTFQLSLYSSSGAAVTLSTITINGTTVDTFLPAAVTLSGNSIASPGILPYITAGRNAIHHFVFSPQIGDVITLGTGISGTVTSLIPPLANSYGGIVIDPGNGNLQYYYFTDSQGFLVTAQDVFQSLASNANPQNVISPSNRIIGVTYSDYENYLNDQRSMIRVVNPIYIGAFVKQYRDLINA
jgi:Base plate wedge protein 53